VKFLEEDKREFSDSSKSTCILCLFEQWRWRVRCERRQRVKWC